MTPLLPCPFCGRPPAVVPLDIGNSFDKWLGGPGWQCSIECHNKECPAWMAKVTVSQLPNFTGKPLSPNEPMLCGRELYEMAAAKWNTRA